MKEKILKLLLETKGHLSGEAISLELGISRTAVWKHIKKLKEEGYDISSVRNKGYMMTQETTELVEDRVRSHMLPSTRFKTVKILESVGSTNDEGKRLLSSKEVDEGVLIAKEQVSGKGRRGRNWASPKDKGIFMSMMLRPDIEPIHASMLTLLAGLAVVKGIDKVCQIQAQIKWPNDVVVNGRKVCGILTEMSAEMDYIHYVVVGIGINVNQDEFPEELSEIATSLKLETGQMMNRPELIGEIIEAFENLYNQFIREKDLSFVIDAYNSRCINVGKALRVIGRNTEEEGVGLEVTKEGTLKIRDNNGNEKFIHSGEVSVRGLYGYV